MAVLEIQSNGDSSYVSQEAINSAIQSLEDPLQRVSRRERHLLGLFKVSMAGWENNEQGIVLLCSGVHPEVPGGRSQ